MAHYACLDRLQTWLDSYLNFEKLPQKNIFWLDAMAFLCKKCANPQDAAPAFHVAGSKGKGSVAAMIASILAAAGYRTGLYTSPHIVDFSERIGGAHGVFDESVYEHAAATLRRTVGALRQEDLPSGRNITWFELVTLYAFLCFREAKTDYNVLEVGLGGRLDATNVITPRICCITPVEREHTEFLGDTIAQIAAEKGGIIKNGVPVVLSRQHPDAKAVFARIEAERNAKLYAIEDIVQEIITEYVLKKEKRAEKSLKNNTSSDNIDSRYASPRMRTTIRSSLFARPLEASLRLLGNVQAENAAQAAVAVKLALPGIDERTIEQGLENAALPGRFEIIARKKCNPCAPGGRRPFVIMDGAHTVRSITGTVQTFRAVFGTDDAHLLFACAADKDIADIAPLFRQGFSRITLTKPGAVKQSNLAALTQAFDAAGLRYTSSEDFSAAIRDALCAAETASVPLLVTGSFYLLAEVKKIIGTDEERAW
ncbi:MAG: bifunctional folylpolyglutamate synthase/dihydrofolate synthase [Treponemataceae bacterium]|nr:bifunctional folylpolyglutamate synthase/dihydrofolate synthase [Treponemataceae bacterium]